MSITKFRGLKTDNSGFEYGHYFFDNYELQAFIINADGEKIDVFSDSIQQFTGLHDKNGKEIYEGEILFNNDRKEHCIVKYSQEKAMFIVEYLESNDEFPLGQSISNLDYSVGNLYENPELLTD